MYGPRKSPASLRACAEPPSCRYLASSTCSQTHKQCRLRHFHKQSLEHSRRVLHSANERPSSATARGRLGRLALLCGASRLQASPTKAVERLRTHRWLGHKGPGTSRRHVPRPAVPKYIAANGVFSCGRVSGPSRCEQPFAGLRLPKCTAYRQTGPGDGPAAACDHELDGAELGRVDRADRYLAAPS